MTLEEIRTRLNEAFPGAVASSASPWGEATLTIQPEQIQPVCRFLRDALNFNFLTDLCGVDQYPRVPRYAVVYHLCAMDRRERLRLKVFLSESSPRVDSVSTIWKAADWLEREVFDMYGIGFDGHPDLRRILTPPGFEDFPLRKDYPLRGK